LHPPAGSDYFFFPHGQFSGVLPFAVDRVGWDNWAIWEGLRRGAVVIDATEVFRAIHQNHWKVCQQGQLPDQEEQREVEHCATYSLVCRQRVFTLEDVPLKLTATSRRRKRSARQWIRNLTNWHVLTGGPGPSGVSGRLLGHASFVTSHGAQAWIQMSRKQVGF
jgi:Mg2+ and Co2+ transporter CorA